MILRTVPKALFSTALILSAVLLLLTSTVGSQSLTTITSWTTVTSQSTSTSSGRTAVATSTGTQTVNNSVVSMQTFTVPAVQPRKCYIHYFTYQGTAGDRLQGRWTSDYVLNFYILSESNYAKWKYCGDPGSTYVTVEMARSYSVNFVLPETGTVYFAFENYAAGSDTSSSRTVTFSLYGMDAQSVTSTLYSTWSSPIVLGTTKTVMSLQYSTIQPSIQPLGGGSYLVIFVVAVVLALVVAAIVMASRRRAGRGASARPKTSQAATRVEKQFCVNCGAELAPNSKFCIKCGSAQTQ
jgi:ribosomal protein L40E